MFLRSDGREFQRGGAEQVKALLRLVERWAQDTGRFRELEVLRNREMTNSCLVSVRSKPKWISWLFKTTQVSEQSYCWPKCNLNHKLMFQCVYSFILEISVLFVYNFFQLHIFQ